MSVADRPDTLDDTSQEISPDQYPTCAVVILLVMSVSTATAERCVSAMRHSTITTESISGLVFMHVHKDRVGC